MRHGLLSIQLLRWKRSNKMSEGTDRNLAINGFASAHAHKDGEARDDMGC